jgi:hypothetical protein
MIDINLKALAESSTPYHYKRWKSEVTNKDKAIMSYIMDPQADSNESKLFRKIAVPISKKYFPDPEKTENTARNKKYIEAVKKKAALEGKIGLTGREYGTVSGIGKNVRKTVPVTNVIFKKGRVFKNYEVYYNTKTNKFTKKPKSESKIIVKVSFEVDFVYDNKSGTGFVVLFAIEKSVDPNSIVWTLGKKGYDIRCAFIHDAIKYEEKIDNLYVYIMGIETEAGNSGVLMEWTAMSISIGRDSYQKRLPTLTESLKSKTYDTYDFVSMREDYEKNEPIKISLNPTLTKQRESKLYW